MNRFQNERAAPSKGLEAKRNAIGSWSAIPVSLKNVAI
jgi:hypothetical protein